ncbi:centrin [Strigomonas culicis]|nr:centrin [Strigomonas culicis]|eukprot:EPY19487.1 centrin [Strigomonas culicis]
MRRMVAEMDRGGVSNNLVLSEFEEIMRQKFFSENAQEEFDLAFPLFTEGRTDFITLEDLRRVAAEVGEDMPEEVLMEMIEAADVIDRDHKISREEFMRMLLPEKAAKK